MSTEKAGKSEKRDRRKKNPGLELPFKAMELLQDYLPARTLNRLDADAQECLVRACNQFGHAVAHALEGPRSKVDTDRVAPS